jgi:hypothetical protein
MVAKLTMLVGVLLASSGIWLHDPVHANGFGVSENAWLLDFVTGLAIMIVGGISHAITAKR